MTRELKFRVWSEETHILYSSEDIRLFPLEDVKNNAVWTFEQYTGLKDKNGKDIYEGDIVKTTRSYGYGFLPKGAKAKVVFDEKELCYKLQGQGEFRLTSKKEVEVIGNDHENPESLKERK